jgi:hypothetical protein
MNAVRHAKNVNLLYRLLIVLVISTLTSSFAANVFAATTSLSWDAPTAYTDGTPITGLGGYKIYMGTTSGSYSQTLDVGNVTSYTVSSLDDANTLYFAVTAYDTTGDVSGFSNQISYTTPAPPPSPTLYTITASAGSGGLITPSGSVAISQGLNQSLSIVPNSGYKIAAVTVDGASVGAVASYSFSNVTANHTISATFAVNAYTITASAGTGGSISPTGTANVTSGGSQAFTITPAAGYTISAVTVDGASVGAVASYTFSNVTANHTIAASFSSSTVSTGKVVFSTNCGGSQFTDSTGVSFVTDTKYIGGYAATAGLTAAISGTVDDRLYRSGRYGKNFSYKIPVSNGNYTVTLKFAENNWTAAGKRVFSVTINGNTVISNLDIFANVGKNAAYDVAIPVSVTNGVLDISFTSQVDNAKVSAILVKSMQ